MKRILKVSLIIIVLFGLIISGALFLYFNNSTSNLINSIQENIPFLEGSENEDTNPSVSSGVSSSGGAGVSSGSGGSSGGGVSGGTTQDCESVQITYSLGTLPTSEICNTYDDEICTEKQVFCYVEVRNLDTIDGTFDVSFIFHERANIGNVFASNNESIFVSSNDNELLSSSRVFTGAEANQNISCATATNSVPVKQVCN